MRILLTAIVSALVTLSAVTLIAGDPFGIIQAGQRLGSSEPEVSASPPQSSTASELSTPMPTPTSESPTETPESDSMVEGEVSISIPELEKLVHQLINEERQEHGLRRLTYDIRLADIARNHSADMASKGYFEHVNPAGEEPSDRGSRQGYNCRKEYSDHVTLGIAENIYQGWRYSSITQRAFVIEKDWNSTKDIAENAVVGWMNSPGHRANILNDAYDVEGIGVAISTNDKVYVTQNFC